MKVYSITAAAFASFAFLCSQASAQFPEPLCPAMADLRTIAPGDQHLEGTFEGEDGWMFSPQDFDTAESLDVTPLLRFAEILETRGTTLVYLVLPDRPLIYPEGLSSEDRSKMDWSPAHAEDEYRELLGKLAPSKVLMPDILGAFAQAASSGDEVYFRRDTHWTTLGARTTAGKIAELIRAHADFPASGIEFATTSLGDFESPGAYGTIARKACGDDFPVETFERQETAPVVALGLLDDEPVPSIAVVGTSFSLARGEDYFNFLGALREFTGEEVVNFAVTGGGTYSSLNDFLDSDFFRDTPPKYLIWEQGRGIKPPSGARSRQLIGALYGQCNGLKTEIVASEGGTIEFNSNVPLSGPTYYLAFQYEDPGVGSHSLQLTYSNGSSETVRMDRGARSSIGGRYYLEIASGRGGLDGMEIVSLESEPDTTVTVSLCKSPDPIQLASMSEKEPVVSDAPVPSSPGTSAVKPFQTGAIELVVSGEQYRGFPEFRVVVDGRTIGAGVVFAKLGEETEVHRFEHFSALDPAQIEVYFGNDLNHGLGTDRNLAIHSITLNGVSLPLTAFERPGPLKVRRLPDGTLKLLSNYPVVATRPPDGWASGGH